MSLAHEENSAGLELAQIIAASPEWQRAKDELVALANAGAGQEVTIAEMRAALTREGLGGEALLACMPAEYAGRLTPDERQAFIKHMDLLMLASVLSDVQNGSPLPLPDLGRGVTTEEHTDGDVAFRVVRAVVTPLDDPALVIAEFVDACYRAFDASVFARHPNAARDAEWWRRHEAAETYRQIALDDPRSGLAPEALAKPEDYAEEITRATDVVRRAVRRFKARWTRKADSLSKKPG